jgi:hypothetical protein
MTAFPYHGLGSKRRLVSGCAFRFQRFYHLVGGGGGSALFEVAGNHKEGGNAVTIKKIKIQPLSGLAIKKFRLI